MPFDTPAEFLYACGNDDCPFFIEEGRRFSWECPGYVEGDTGAGVLYNESGESDDDPPGPVCEHCETEGESRAF